MVIRIPAMDAYRELIEQGFSPSNAAAHVKIVYDVELTEAQRVLAERGPLPAETF